MPDCAEGRGPTGFFFYSADQVEPPHVHVRRDRQTAKFWLDPVAMEKKQGNEQTPRYAE